MGKSLSEMALCFTVLALGTFLRFHALDRQSLWNDELSTINTISQPKALWMERFKTYETHPPLYFLQLKLWQKAGARSLVRLRANAAFWGSLSLVLIYLVGRRYSGSWAGLLASLYAALSPFHLSYSQEIRPYGFAIVLALGAILVLQEALERDSKYWWMGAAFLWTAQLYTHYWGAFLVLAQGLYSWTQIQERHQRIRLLGALAVAGTAFCLWLPVLHAQMSVIREVGFWVQPFSFASLAKTFAAFSGLFFNMASNTFYLPTVTGLVLLLGLAHLLALAMGLWKGPVVLRSWLCVGLGLPWLLSIVAPSIYLWYRYTFHVFPAFVLLLVTGMLEWRPRLLQGTLIAVCLATQAWGTTLYFTQWQKANPKDVVSYVHQRREPNTLVVRPSYFAQLFYFYDRGILPAMDEHLLDSREKRAGLKGKNILLIAFDVPSDPVADAFLTEFKVVSARHFPGFAHLGITVYQLQ